MSKRRAFRIGFLIVGLLAVGLPAMAQQQGQGGGKPSEEEIMKQMMELAAPGPEHKALDRLVGTWNATIKMWMGPGEPSVTTGNATYEWILGGRFLKSTHKSTMMGMPFEGMGLEGYDRAQKRYISLWFDTMGTGYMSLIGNATADAKRLTYTGAMFDPAQGHDVKVREEVEWVDANKFVFSMYAEMPGPDGKPTEMKAMEMTAVRQ